MTIEEKGAEEYANSIVPNPSYKEAPYYTTGEKWNDIKDAFIVGIQRQKEQPLNNSILINDKILKELFRLLKEVNCDEINDIVISKSFDKEEELKFSINVITTIVDVYITKEGITTKAIYVQ